MIKIQINFESGKKNENNERLLVPSSLREWRIKCRLESPDSLPV